MKIIKLTDYPNINKIWEMWNDELGFIFPISSDLFDKNVLSYSGYQDTSFVAMLDEQIVGFIIGKIWKEDFEIPGYNDASWISLIYVKPQYRKCGIGTQLLEKVEQLFINENKKVIYLGKDYKNFFPGLPVDLKYYKEWFTKRGYEAIYDTNDLIRHIDNGTPLEKLLEYNDHKNYIIKRADTSNLESLNLLLKNNWPGRWHAEFLDYLKSGGTGYEYMICLSEEGQVVGFCKVCDSTTDPLLTSYSLNFKDRFLKLGGIGPLGVDVAFRKRNIASNLIKTCINELIKEGASDIIIDWTNLMHIYRKYSFEIWKSYTYVNKTINK